VQTTPVYEVRCERCRTSFAPETRRCVHCGGPLGRGRAFGSVPSGSTVGTSASTDEDAEGLEVLARGRSPLWLVTAVLVLLASMLRNCLGGG
jgi:hypothetical protein